MRTTYFPHAITLPLVGLLLALSPFLAAEGLQCHIEDVDGMPRKLVWPSETGQLYDVWFSPDLTGWTHVDGYPQPGTGGEMEHAFTLGTRGFFRITSEEAPPEGFVLIPAGNFEMGDKVGRVVGGDGNTNELPVHTVYVSGFYMGRYEVTKASWDEVWAWGLDNGYADLPVGSGKAPNHPVYGIDWYEIVKWCNARSEKEGLAPCYRVGGSVYRTGSNDAVTCDWNAAGYRLPSEAEWEKAARGGASGHRFPWSDSETIQHARANYFVAQTWGTNGHLINALSYDTSPTAGYHPTFFTGDIPYTSPVGYFAPNGYGLYDMAGNAWEWCWDWFDADYYLSSPGTDPRGPATGSHRVNRGGSSGSHAFWCRAAGRENYLVPGIAYKEVGFRTARSSVP